MKDSKMTKTATVKAAKTPTSKSTVFAPAPTPVPRVVYNYKIEAGIPLPKRKTGMGRPISKIRAAVEKMAVNDSTLVPLSMSTKRGMTSFRSMVSNVQKEMGTKYAVRRMEDGRYRMWRLA